MKGNSTVQKLEQDVYMLENLIHNVIVDPQSYDTYQTVILHFSERLLEDAIRHGCLGVKDSIEKLLDVVGTQKTGVLATPSAEIRQYKMKARQPETLEWLQRFQDGTPTSRPYKPKISKKHNHAVKPMVVRNDITKHLLESFRAVKVST
jgi:hypothetical protein